MAGLDPAIQSARVCGMDESVTAFIRRADARRLDGRLRGGHGERAKENGLA